MKFNRKKAFTLPELLIGMIIILLVMGGVVATLRSGIDLFVKAEANGKVTTGVRFTVASFKSEVLPLVNKSSSIEILKDMSGVPATISNSGDCYIYRSSDCTVRCRSRAGDLPLEGSEYISALNFSVPKSSEDKAVNYLLSMHVEGQDPNHTVAFTSVDIAMALFNEPEKSSTSNLVVTDYSGGVLHFSAFDFNSLRVWSVSKDAAANKQLYDNEAVAKDSILELRYNISVPAGKKDATKMQWYASTVSSKDMKRSDLQTTITYGSATKSTYYWPLLVKTGTNQYRLANEDYASIDMYINNGYLDVPTSGDDDGYLYVYTGNNLTSDFTDGVLNNTGKAQSFAKYCFLRAWVVPGYMDKTGETSSKVYPVGYEQWSDTIQIQPTTKAGNKFWSEWVTALDNAANDKYTSQHWKATSGNTTIGTTIDPDTGKYEATLTRKGDTGSNNAQIAKVLRPDHLQEARLYEKAAYGKSYTTVTNYSYIVNAKVGTSTAGIALLLNAYRNASSPNNRTLGYAFYYDPGANGYPIRLQSDSGIVGGYQANGVNELESPLKTDINVAARNGNYFNDNFYNPQYSLPTLQNNIYNGVPESSTSTLLSKKKGDYTDECKYMQGQCRFMVTVLEYYDATAGDEYPRFLVRLKLLKSLDDVLGTTHTAAQEKVLRADDPFLIGPKFSSSEPAWYGFFVGQKPKLGYTSSLYDKQFDHYEWVKTGTYTWYDWNGDPHEEETGYYDRIYQYKYQYNWGYYFEVIRANNVDVSFDRTIDKTTYSDWTFSKTAPVVDVADYPKKGLTDTYQATPQYHAVQTPYNTNAGVSRYSSGSTSGGGHGGVFKRALLSPRDSLGNTYNTASYLGSTKPNRSRWIGIGLWGGQLSGASEVTIYEFILAPGFDGGELKSILPSGATVYDMKSTCGNVTTTTGSVVSMDLGLSAAYTDADDGPGVWKTALFGSASGTSDGTGNTKQGNEYKDRFTGADNVKQICVESLQHTGGTNCGCPMCKLYNAYKNCINKISWW